MEELSNEHEKLEKHRKTNGKCRKKLPEKVLPELLGKFDAFCQVVPHADRVVFRAGHYQRFPVISIIIVQ